MTYKITSPVDEMVARAEAERIAAESIVDEVREMKKYHHEKASLKVLAFYEAHEKMVRRYAELKAYHPALAKVIEEQRPYLLELYHRAERDFVSRNI